MWGLPAIETADGDIPVVLDADRGGREPAEIGRRAQCLVLVALKGQGLSQHEVFAIADAWELWEDLSLEENDFILDPSPDDQAMRNAAWRFEGVQVLAWSLGLIRHLAFADTPADTGKITETVLTQIAGADPTGWTVRTRAEVLDAADVAVRCQVLLDAGAGAALHPGLVHERAVAFDWLVPPAP
jgi:hypothetical protein